jgi:hypothetical protein
MEVLKSDQFILDKLSLSAVNRAERPRSVFDFRDIATAKAVKTEEEDNRAILNQPQNDGKSIQLRLTPKSSTGN